MDVESIDETSVGIAGYLADQPLEFLPFQEHLGKR